MPDFVIRLAALYAHEKCLKLRTLNIDTRIDTRVNTRIDARIDTSGESS